jgi:Uma2 family endonuclease
MDQPTFHKLYLKTPAKFRAELIVGVVHIGSRVTARHGGSHANIIWWIAKYSMTTPGTAAYDNTTTILSDDTEPQPDAALLIDQRHGGQTRIDRQGYIQGAPEFIAEIADSSDSIDLGAKKGAYEKAGVGEYLVISVIEEQVHWFVRRSCHFEPLVVAEDGVLKSELFPGLWLHPAAFFKPSKSRFRAVTKKGLDSPEHSAFVVDLEARRKAQSSKPGNAASKKPPRPRS